MTLTTEVILARASRIPAGFVATYGDLCPSAPRHAGRALAGSGDHVPWWRVVRSDGTWAKGSEQRNLLAAEDVPLRGDRVLLKEARIDPEALY